MRAPRALAAVLAGVLGLLTLGAGAAAGGAPAGQISAVRATPGQVRLVFSAPGLPAGVRLDAGTVRVTADGQALRATAQPTGTGPTAQPTGTGPTGAQRSSPPRAAMIVLDASGSMVGAGLAAARAAALGYSRNLPADVLVGLVTFAGSPRLALPPTTDRAALAAALAWVQAGGPTALYDGLRLAASALAAASPAGGGQRRLVVLSDGKDTVSAGTLAGTLGELSRDRVATDVLAFRLAADGVAVLGQIAAASGGRVLPAASAADLAAPFSTVARTSTQRVLVQIEVPGELAGRRARLEVSAAAGGQVVRASVELTLPAASTSPAGGPPGAAGGSAGGGLTLWLVLGLTFVSLLGLGLLAAGSSAGPRRGKGRIADLERYRVGGGSDPPEPAATDSGGVLARVALRWADTLVRGGRRARIAADLDRAALWLRPQEWMLLRISVAVTTAAALALLSGSPPLGAPGGALLGWLATRKYLSRRISRRSAAFGGQLPDVLQLVAGSLRSGFSLAQALDGVVREGSQPVAGEFSRALDQTRLGAKLEDALETVASRIRSADLSWVVMAVRIQREVGGNLAEVLTTTVYTMRDRAQVRRQVRALTAEGRLSAYILIGLPLGLAGWLFLTRGEYMRPLYTQTMGIAMLVAASLLVLVGSFWMSRLVKVEV
jgi:tight adherence protein B